MFDTTIAKMDFSKLSHTAKVKKIKAILMMLKDKSPIFTDLYDKIKDKDTIADNISEYIYDVIMTLVGLAQKKVK